MSRGEPESGSLPWDSELCLHADSQSTDGAHLNRAHCLPVGWKTEEIGQWVRHPLVLKGIFLRISENYKQNQEFKGRWRGQGQIRTPDVSDALRSLLRACHSCALCSNSEPKSERKLIPYWGGMLTKTQFEVSWTNWSSPFLHLKDFCLKYLPLHESWGTQRGYYTLYNFLKYSNWWANGINLESYTGRALGLDFLVCRCSHWHSIFQ